VVWLGSCNRGGLGQFHEELWSGDSPSEMSRSTTGRSDSALTGLWSDFGGDGLSAANTAGMGAAGGGAGTSIQVMSASGQGRPSGHSFQFFPSSSKSTF